MRYISDIIKDEFKQWTNHKPILISAPTGSGKTTFILNNLLPYVKEQGKYLVYFVNRSALKKQINNQIPDRLKDSIIVETYQHVPNMVINPFDDKYLIKENRDFLGENNQKLGNADYYVYDEAHFFTADAAFNELSVKSMLCNSKAVEIFITATVSDFLIFDNADKFFWSSSFLDSTNRMKLTFSNLFNYCDCNNEIRTDILNFRYSMTPWNNMPCMFMKYSWYIGRVKEMNGVSTNVVQNIHNTEFPRHYFNETVAHFHGIFKNIKAQKYHTYECEPDYSYIRPRFYDNNKELIDYIASSPSEEKWLIFVNSKKNGNKICSELQQRNISSEFISADDKNQRSTVKGRLFDKLLKEEKFDVRVLITTKVLDNGVSIKDPALRHIVICSMDRTSFVQMLGRKRLVSDDETVFLYLQNISEAYIRRDISHRIIPIFKFIKELRYRDSPRPDTSFEDKKDTLFYLRFIDANGTVKKPYSSYVQFKRYFSDSVYTGFRTHNLDRLIEEKHSILYALIYEYYSLMAILENARNLRNNALCDLCEEKTAERNHDDDCLNLSVFGSTEPDLPEWYKEADQSLARCQYTWLHYQLSWLGLDTKENSPENLRLWPCSQKIHPKDAKDIFADFLEDHVGKVLEKSDQEYLSKLYIALPDSDRRSKGGLCSIRKYLEANNYSYTIINNLSTKAKDRHRVWQIERKTASESDTSRNPTTTERNI